MTDKLEPVDVMAARGRALAERLDNDPRDSIAMSDVSAWIHYAVQLLAAPPAPAQEPPGWREALQFYADRSHFSIADEDAWDTVSGEPTNFWCDEAGTATVEDGTVAAMALAGTPLPDEDGADSPAPAQEPVCPDCKGPGLLYECAHCGCSNYPKA